MIGEHLDVLLDVLYYHIDFVEETLLSCCFGVKALRRLEFA